MAASGIPLIIQSVIITAAFKLLRLVFTGVQRLIWRLNGTAQLVMEARLPENYDRCAHVLDILLHHQFDILHTFALGDFICTHNRFDSPGYILENDHVSLFTVTENEAIFVEARSEDMMLWKAKYSPFIRNAQVENCRRLIVVPMSAFCRMADELGDPKGQLVFLFNTGRCGSTLLTQMMEFTGVCVTVSEPDAANVLATRYRKRGNSSKLQQEARSALRWVCRPYKSIQPAAYVLKISGQSAYAAPLLTELFPNSRCLYMYRDPVKVAQSAYRASLQLPSLGLTYILGKYSARLTAKSFDLIGLPGDEYEVKLFDDLTFGIYLVIRTATAYLELRRRGFTSAAVRYEDLLEDPMFVCKQILEFCGLSTSLASLATNGLNIDSQRNTPVSRDLLRRHKVSELTEESKSSANGHLKKFGLPLIGEEFLLEGTISKKL